jgi:hypothetical protein
VTAGAELGVRALNRALLDRQLLTRRAGMSAEQAVEHLVGMQAQAVNPPYVGLWTRLARFDTEELSTLLLDRRAVRIALMRSTIHLVTARDCLALSPLMSEMLARAAKGQFGKQVEGLEAAEIIALGAKLVEERPLTFAELGRLMAERWPERDGFALAQSVRNLVPLAQVTPRGLWNNNSPAAHTTVTGWLGRPLEQNPSIDGYVLRYLAAFGPASVMDMQKWSGLTRLKEAFTRLGPRLRVYRDERGVQLFDLAETELPDRDAEVPVRFLPDFDNIVLSHANRDRIMAQEYRARIFTVNGIIRSTILVDGFVQGLWRIDRAKDLATLVVEPFAPLRKKTVAALAKEGEGLLRFAASDASRHDVRFEPAG